MADLSPKDSASSTKLVGATPDGTETNYVNVTAEGEIKTSNFANVAFVDANITVSTTEILASATGTNLANRKTLVIFNRGNRVIYYGTTGVSSTTGIAIQADELISFDIGENINIYLVTSNGTSSVTIQEFS
jgi:hypothetical protein